MHYYWPGLDYAKWIFCLGAAGCFFGMLTEPAGAKRGWLKLAGCCAMAVGVLCGGLAGVLFNERAPRHSVAGTVTHVEVYGGRSSRTKFDLQAQTGEPIALSMDRAVYGIRNGDVVRVTYQEASGAVLSLTGLTGPYAGNQTEGSDGEYGSWMAVLAAVVLAGYGILDWFNDGNAIPAEPRNQQSLDGDVDSKSMLNLSGRG